MQLLEVSGAVRPIYWLLGVKRLRERLAWVLDLTPIALTFDVFVLSPSSTACCHIFFHSVLTYALTFNYMKFELPTAWSNEK